MSPKNCLQPRPGITLYVEAVHSPTKLYDMTVRVKFFFATRGDLFRVFAGSPTA
jgi:hypothetical protein